MRKEIILTATLILITGLSTAVVGANNSSGDMQITDSETSASSTTAVGPNGTEYETTFSVFNKSSSAEETGLINYSFDGDQVNFNGVIKTPTPCYTVTHSVNKTGDATYNFNINTEEENGTCAQVITYHRYKANFEASEPYELTVSHGDSEQIITHEDYGGDVEEPGESKGLLSGFISFLNNLFN